MGGQSLQISPAALSAPKNIAGSVSTTIEGDMPAGAYFEVGFVFDGKTIPVKFPIIAPNFQQSAEIVPEVDLAAHLAHVDALNHEMVDDWQVIKAGPFFLDSAESAKHVTRSSAVSDLLDHFCVLLSFPPTPAPGIPAGSSRRFPPLSELPQ